VAFAGFLRRGDFDRHLRRTRARYRARRDTVVAALAEALPEATVRGIAAGLHVTAELPEGYDEGAIAEEARRRRIALETLADYRFDSPPGRPTLLLCYGRLHEDALRRGVQEVADVVRATAPGS
jgi:GntR family transcriptional regulator / MocR family aminotransferase